MSSNPPPSKRAKTAISKTFGTRETPAPPLLSAEDVAHIFDFLCYEDLRSALLCGRFVANDVARHVRTITITSKTELNIPAARRFVNVREVNVLCLVKGVVVGSIRRQMFSAVTARRTVPFLSSFPNLHSANLGGTRQIRLDLPGSWYAIDYIPGICVYPDNHAELYRGLLQAICGAYSSGALPPDVSFGQNSYAGLVSSNSEFGSASCPRPTSCKSKAQPCRFCYDLCHNLPLRDVLALKDGQTCINNSTRIAIVSKRPHGKAAIKKCKILERMIPRVGIHMSEILKNRIAQNPDMRGHLKLQNLRFLPNQFLEVIDSFLQRGLEPVELDISNQMWLKDSIDELRARGFTIRMEGVTLVQIDDKMNCVQELIQKLIDSCV